MIATPATPLLYRDPAYSIAERVQDLLARMTLDEKIAQLGSYWVYELQDEHGLSQERAAALIGHGIGQITRVGGASTLAPRDIARMGNTIQSYLVERTRLGIPAILHEECCNGYLALGATSFPQMIGLASTWEPELVQEMLAVIRAQMLAVGARQGLSPMLDVARDARWGRVEETFGEDPTLVSQMGIAYVRGLQGMDLREGVIATGKHFPGHSISEGGLNCTPVHLGAREMRDVFLMPFEAVIREAHIASIMNSYSEMDGVVVASSRAFMTELLRDELGFDGLAVSDYYALDMLHNFHHVTPNPADAARLALHAGMDIELPTTSCYGAPLREAVQAGSVSEALLDVSVARILQIKFELGLFENPFVDVDGVLAAYETPAQRQLARRIATRSIVLLQNKGSVLPLSKTLGTLAVIGPTADSARNLFADYSHPAHIENLLERTPEVAALLKLDTQANGLIKGSVHAPTILDAIREHVSTDTRILYAKGCAINDNDCSGIAEAVRVAGEADVVILVVGDKSGLAIECTSGESRDRADICLPGVQQDLVDAVTALGKLTVVVLVNGRPIAIPRIAEHVPAILEAWLPGEEGGAAIADILFGDANPGGKLPITIPRAVGQIPIFYNHKPSGGRSHWHGDYVSLPVTPLYPFGHGLSYTTFEYSDLRVTPHQVSTDGQVTVSVRVKNTGTRAGDEVVQLYVRDEVASVPRPVQELKGFVRIPLAPAETRTVEFEMSVDQLAFYNERMQLVVEPGTIQVMVGSSSQDIRLKDVFEIVGPEQRIVPRRVFYCVTRVD